MKCEGDMVQGIKVKCEGDMVKREGDMVKCEGDIVKCEGDEMKKCTHIYKDAKHNTRTLTDEKDSTSKQNC